MEQQDLSALSEHKKVQTSVAIRGMNCASCAARLEKALKSADDITDANVNIATHKATIYTETEPDMARIKALVS